LGLFTNDDGLFNLPAIVKSEDGKASLTIAKGVIGQTKENTGLKSIRIVPLDSPPVAPAGSVMTSLVYEMTPDGATFAPSIVLTLLYDPAKLPKDIDIDSLTIGVFNTLESRWDALQSAHNKTDFSLTAVVDHLSNYTIIGRIKVASLPLSSPVPASFTITDVTVSPATGVPGQSVTVSAKVSNTGGTSGEHEVIVRINGAVETTKRVSVGAGGSAVVTFAVTKLVAGDYQVDVNGSASSFTVTKLEPASSPVSQLATPVPVAPDNQGTNTAWIIGVIIGVLVLGAGVFAFRRFRTLI
jgi:hypothetical protein